MGGIRRITQAPIRAGGRVETAPIRAPSGISGGTITGARVTRKTTGEWAAMRTYVPGANEIIVYTDHAQAAGTDVPGIKIGDGNAFVVDLPFIDAAVAATLQEHIADAEAHVSAEDREFWDNKLNYDIDGEALTFTRL